MKSAGEFFYREIDGCTVVQRGEAKCVLRRLDKGHSQMKMVRDTGLSRTRIRSIVLNRHAYDPSIDRIAVRRALAGDDSVLDAMTVFERRALRRKLLELRAVDTSEIVRLERKLGLEGLADMLETETARTKVQVDREEVAA